MPLYLFGVPKLIPELQWMLVGEQINKGFVMYSEIWDNTAPLSAFVYAGIDKLFGRSTVAYQLMGFAVAAIQVIYFNVLINDRDILPKRNYLPGLFYALFLNISFDCCTLSPALMGNTFILLAFGTLVRQISRLQATDEVFEIGFYIGLATLLYPPAGVFIFWAIASLAFFSGATIRQHSLAIFGFLFPLFLTVLFFYMYGTYESFLGNFVSSVFQIRQYNLNDFSSLIITLIIPFGLAIMGFLRLVNAGGFVNFQIRCQQVMMLWAIFGFLSIGLMPFLAPMQFIIFVPVCSFFTIQFFSTIKKNVIAEFIFILVLGLVLLIHYEGVYFKGLDGLAQLESLVLKDKTTIPFKSKKVLVLGNGMEEYRDNFVATPYLNWNLAKYELEGLDNYNNVISILKNFESDSPEIIIDKVNLAPKLFKRIPVLQRRYREIGKGVYQLK